MIDGLWIVHYEGIQGEGSGVLVFTHGRALGGDIGYTYEGNYEIKDNWIVASVHVTNYLPKVASMLGFGFVGDFDLELKAPIKGNVIQATMSVVGHPDMSIVAKLTKKSDL